MIADVLLADADWMKLIVPLIMFSVYALNRLFGGETPAAKQAQARRQARAKPPPKPPVEKQRVEDEVTEFLRRAGQQRGTGTATRTPQAAPPQPPLVQRTPNLTPPAPEPAPPKTKHRTLTPTLSDPLRNRTLEERTVEPKEVEEAESAMKSHLSQVFGHAVGTLGDDQPVATASAATAAASEVTDMLRDPQSVRNAIIVSEILRRPTERW